MRNINNININNIYEEKIGITPFNIMIRWQTNFKSYLEIYSS